jgi:hypothetical protein
MEDFIYHRTGSYIINRYTIENALGLSVLGKSEEDIIELIAQAARKCRNCSKCPYKHDVNYFPNVGALNIEAFMDKVPGQCSQDVLIYRAVFMHARPRFSWYGARLVEIFNLPASPAGIATYLLEPRLQPVLDIQKVIGRAEYRRGDLIIAARELGFTLETLDGNFNDLERKIRLRLDETW